MKLLLGSQKYTSIKDKWNSIQKDKKLREMRLAENIISYLDQKGWPEVYSPEELNEKYYVLDWLAVNLVGDRPLETKELYLYGGPDCQGLLLLEMLSKVLPIVRGTDKMRKRDYDKCDLSSQILIVENSGFCWGWRQDGKSLSKRLFSLLDLLDWKKKHKVNIPLIMIGDHLPTSFRVHDTPWAEMLMPLKLFSNFPQLSEDRVIATFWNAFVTRACTRDLMGNPAISYNSIRVENYILHSLNDCFQNSRGSLYERIKDLFFPKERDCFDPCSRSEGRRILLSFQLGGLITRETIPLISL